MSYTAAENAVMKLAYNAEARRHIIGKGPDIAAKDKSGMVHAVYRYCGGRRFSSHCGKIYKRGERRVMRNKTTEAPSCIVCLTEMRT